MSKQRKKAAYAAFIILTVCSIGYTAIKEFYGKNYQGIDFASVGITFVTAALLCFFAALAFEAVKYAFLLKALTGRSHCIIAFETGALGRFYDNITPSGVGGQPFQIFFLKKLGLDVGTSAAIPIAGFLTSQLGFCAIALCAFIFVQPNGIPVTARLLAYIGFAFYMFMPTLIIFFAIFPKKAGAAVCAVIKLGGKLRLCRNPDRLVEKASLTLNSYRADLLLLYRKKAVMLASLSIGIIYHLLIFTVPYFVLQAFGSHMDWIQCVSLCAYVSSSVAIVPTPGNSGAAELSFYTLFDGVGQDNLFFAMLLWRFITYYMFLLTGVAVNIIRAITRTKENHNANLT